MTPQAPPQGEGSIAPCVQPGAHPSREGITVQSLHTQGRVTTKDISYMQLGM